MGRLCTVCSHPDREEIDFALMVHAASYRSIARQFAVSDDALIRHEREHLWHTLAQSQELSSMLSAEYLLAELTDLLRVDREIVDSACAAGDWRAATAAAHVAGEHLLALWRLVPEARARKTQEAFQRRVALAHVGTREDITGLADRAKGHA